MNRISTVVVSSVIITLSAFAQTAPYTQLPATTNFPSLATTINGKANISSGSGVPTTAVCTSSVCTPYLDWYVDTTTNNLWEYTSIGWGNAPVIWGNTFTNSQHSIGGCQEFPDSNYTNVDVSNFPVSLANSTYNATLTPANPTISAASWTAGVVTATLSSTTGITSGNQYEILGVSPAGYNNSLANGPYFTITVVNSTTITYPLASNPGTYVSGGTFYLNFYRMGSTPSMAINLATNATPTVSFHMAGSGSNPVVADIESDSNPMPFVSTMLTEGYVFGSPNACTLSTLCGGDNHFLVLNTDTCTLWEAFFVSNPATPTADSIAVWYLRTNLLRPAYTNWLWAGLDSTGMTSGDVAGMPITPMVLTHAELYSGNPIKHPIRITFDQTKVSLSHAFVWPATHSGTLGTGTLPIGARLILPSGYSGTCNHFDNIGQPFSNYAPITRLITAMQHYGVVFADFGVTGLLTADNDQAWGDPANPASDTFILNGWLHCIQAADFTVIRENPTQGINSGAIK